MGTSFLESTPIAFQHFYDLVALVTDVFGVSFGFFQQLFHRSFPFFIDFFSFGWMTVMTECGFDANGGGTCEGDFAVLVVDQ